MGCQGKEGIKKQKEFLSGIENISNGIKEFIQDIKGVKTGKKSSINLGQVDSRTTGAIKEKLNIDISDYTRVIDNFAINHVFKRHGGDIEYKRGQIPITDDDFLFYQDIVTKWDSIKTSTTKQGRDAIIYEKQYLDTVYVVEEIRTGKKELALTTMYKKKATTKPASDSTDRVLHARDVSPDNIIPKKNILEKGLEKSFDGAKKLDQKMGEVTGKVFQFFGADELNKGFRLSVDDITKQIGEMTNDFRIGMRQIYDEGAEIKKVLDESLSSENSQLLVQALNGDISPIKLPPELKITYTKLRGQIDANANKLIEAGALDKKFKIDDYVKRIYKEDVESRNAVGKMYFNSRFKARKNLTHDERIALGMIEDATLVIPKTLAEQRAQLLKANTLKNIADKFGKDEAFDGSVLISDQTNGGGVYKYGALAGKYVPKEVADAVVGAGIVKENLGILERLWFPLIDHIKVNVTVKNPFTHVYNVGSNLSLAYLHGDFGSLTKVMSMMVSDKAGFKALVQRANRLGLNSYLGEMEIANPLHNADKDHAVLKILKNMYLSKDSKLGDMARKAYDWEDKIFKLASFHRHLSEGMDEKMAMKLAQESYVDYSTPLPGVVRMMDKSGLMPFLHYSYKSTPMVLRAIAKNPLRFMIFQAALVGTGASSWLGSDNEHENAFKPKWAESGDVHGLFGVKNWTPLGNGWHLNTGRLLPGMRFNGFDVDIKLDGGFLGSAIKILDGKTPLGYDYVGTYDSRTERIVKGTLEMAKNYMPPLSLPGRYGQQLTRKATGIDPAQNYYKEEMSYLEIFGRGLGFRQFNEQKELQSEVNALKKQYNYESNKEGITRVEKQQLKQNFDLKLRKLKSYAQQKNFRLDLVR